MILFQYVDELAFCRIKVVQQIMWQINIVLQMLGVCNHRYIAVPGQLNNALVGALIPFVMVKKTVCHGGPTGLMHLNILRFGHWPLLRRPEICFGPRLQCLRNNKEIAHLAPSPHLVDWNASPVSLR